MLPRRCCCDRFRVTESARRSVGKSGSGAQLFARSDKLCTSPSFPACHDRTRDAVHSFRTPASLLTRYFCDVVWGVGESG